MFVPAPVVGSFDRSSVPGCAGLTRAVSLISLPVLVAVDGASAAVPAVTLGRQTNPTMRCASSGVWKVWA